MKQFSGHVCAHCRTRVSAQNETLRKVHLLVVHAVVLRSLRRNAGAALRADAAPGHRPALPRVVCRLALHAGTRRARARQRRQAGGIRGAGA